MRAVLRCDLQDGVDDWAGLLSIRVAGLSVLERHLLAFQSAGLNEVTIQTASPGNGLKDVVQCSAPKGVRVAFSSEQNGDSVLEVRADTLVDPRLIRELVKLNSTRAGAWFCTDLFRGNYPSSEKSPYRIGSAGINELTDTGENGHPIGVSIRSANGDSSRPSQRVAIGKYYWHRIVDAGDVPEATRKVFLSTMKATDGIYARTNRRVSIPISRLLVRTPVTPNMVTLVGLCCSLAGAWMYSLGTYWTMVAGSLVSWFASMLDGCDGEVARAKFQASEFGAWFEMICDYLYYVVMFLGMGVGIARYTGNPAWTWLGIGSVFGTVVSFVVIARLKKRHARRNSAADFGRTFQSKVGSHKSNPFHFLTRHLGFLITRAAMPYFIVAFTLLDIAPLVLGLILVGTNIAWFLTLCAYPLFRELTADG